MIGDDTHTLTIGATRSGKTRCLVIQSICSIALSGESLVISDPKAELYHYTADYLKKLGYEVIGLDFKNPEKSTRYNLLQPVIDAINEDDVERAEMYAWDITNILVGDNTSNEKIWENNRKVREAREQARPVLSARTEEIPLWNIWVYYTKDLQLKEAQQKSQTFGAQAGSMFSSVKGYRRTGGSDKNEEED